MFASYDEVYVLNDTSNETYIYTYNGVIIYNNENPII